MTVKYESIRVYNNIQFDVKMEFKLNKSASSQILKNIRKLLYMLSLSPCTLSSSHEKIKTYVR